MNSSFHDDPLFVGDAATGRETELLPREMEWKVARNAMAVTACVAFLGPDSDYILLLLELTAL